MLYQQGEQFLYRHGRPLERAIFEYRFKNGNPERIIQILHTYQNEDGGFGHAIEPDLRTPESQPLYCEFALSTLYECGLHAPDMALRTVDYIASCASLDQGIATIFPSSARYARAAHWDNPSGMEPSFERLAGIVGLLNWQGIRHPWLEQAVEKCTKRIADLTFEDAHTILHAFCLLESLEEGKAETGRLYDKLADELTKARFFNLEAPVNQYGLTPLDFAPRPDSFCRPLFQDSTIEGHVEHLKSKQKEDGGWDILWTPPGETAKWEWRAHLTLKVMSIMRAYGAI